MVHKTRLVIECCAGSKLGAVSVDKALVIEDKLQLDAVIGIMLILQAEITENGIAAIEQIDGGCLTGSIFANEGHRVKYIKLIGNSLQLVLFIFRCLFGFCYKVNGEVIAAIFKIACDYSKKFHVQTPPRIV